MSKRERLRKQYDVPPYASLYFGRQTAVDAQLRAAVGRHPPGARSAALKRWLVIGIAADAAGLDAICSAGAEPVLVGSADLTALAKSAAPAQNAPAFAAAATAPLAPMPDEGAIGDEVGSMLDNVLAQFVT